MSAILSSLTLAKRIPRWVNLSATLSSISCTNAVQIDPIADHKSLNTSDFEAKIQFLRNKLCPDNLVRVLDNTIDLNSAVRIFKWAALQKRFQHTAKTYYCMIFKLGMAGNVKEMEGFCQNMVNDRCPGREHVFVSLVDCFVRHCRLNEAIRVLVNMNLAGFQPSVNVFNGVLGALVEDKQGFQDVLFVYKEMVKAGVIPNVDTLNYLLEVLFETERVESALGQFRRMNKKGCSPNSRTFEILIKGLIEKSRVDDAVTILHEMFEIGCQPEMSFYMCSIPLFCRENKLEEGMRLFRMMRAANLVPHSLVYGVLIQCLCKNLWLDDAINLLEEMMESGSTPDNDVFVDFVNGFCRLGRTDEAIKFLEDKYVFETPVHNALLGGCCDAGDFFAAKGLLDRMFERNMANCGSWNILIRWLCEKIEIRKALELLGRMIVSSSCPDSATFSALVVGNCRLRKYENALELFYQVRSKCWVLDSVSYCELVEVLCWEKKYLEAAEVFRYMSKNICSLQSSSFDMLIKGICDMGKVDEAARLPFWANTSGTPCTNSTYNMIMLELYKMGRKGDLLLVLGQMLTEGCPLDTQGYCILIQSLIAQNHMKDCALLFNMMVNEGLVPDSETLCNLLLCLANKSKLYLISNAINKFVCDGELLDAAMYNILINGLWKEGNKSEAHRLLDLMLEKGWIPDAKTHGQLIGSTVEDESDGGTLARENFIIQDDVSNILAEGLTKT